MFTRSVFLAAFLASVLLLSCTSWLDADNDNSDGQGSILVVALLEENNSTGLRATAHTRLFLRLLDDSDNVLKDTSIASGDATIFCDIGKIPAGKECKIIAWTQDATGEVIHSPDTKTVIVEANKNSRVVLNLQPRVGSIIALFTNISSTIDSFFMVFDSDSGFFQARVPRAAHVFLALDNVPYGATGILSLHITRQDKSMLIEWDTLFTFRRENVSLEFSFINNGGMNVSVNIKSPYNTIIAGFGDPRFVLDEETNVGVLVTEFSYNYGTNRNFVKVANLSDKEISFKELSVEIVGANNSRSSTIARDVTLLPQQTFLFANRAFEDFWKSLEYDSIAFGSMALVSTASMILLRGDGVLIDYVLYFGTNAAASGWVSAPTRTSMVLTTNVADPKINNFPSNWRPATDTAFIDGSTVYFGSPGKL